jgi:hypothetical protein
MSSPNPNVNQLFQTQTDLNLRYQSLTEELSNLCRLLCVNNSNSASTKFEILDRITNINNQLRLNLEQQEDTLSDINRQFEIGNAYPSQSVVETIVEPIVETIVEPIVETIIDVDTDDDEPQPQPVSIQNDVYGSDSDSDRYWEDTYYDEPYTPNVNPSIYVPTNVFPSPPSSPRPITGNSNPNTNEQRRQIALRYRSFKIPPKLSSKRFSKKDATNESDCPICFEKHNKTSLVTLGCNHDFCSSCIGCHIDASETNQPYDRNYHCPVCRDNINSVVLNYSSLQGNKKEVLKSHLAQELKRFCY